MADDEEVVMLTRAAAVAEMTRGIDHLRALADSVLIRRGQLARGAGLTFGGDRDLRLALGYKENLDFKDYWWRYKRGGIGRRIVSLPAAATWRNCPVIREGSKTSLEPTVFEQAFKDLAKNVRLWHYLERVDRLAGVGNYAVMMYGFSDSAELDSPVGSGPAGLRLQYLSVFKEDRIEIKSIVSDVKDPRFGLPETYELDFSSDELVGVKLATPKRNVHFSRVLHVAESLDEDEIFGDSRLHAVWNRLDDLDKVVGAAAEAYWQRAQPGIHANVDPSKFDQFDKLEELRDQIDEFQHGYRRVLRTIGVEVSQLASDVANPGGAVEAIVGQIAGTTGIPQRILLGSERGQLASEQDRANWNETVMTRQQCWAEPAVLRPFIDQMIEVGVLPEPDEPYEIEWPDQNALTETQRANVAARYAQASLNASNQTVATEAEVRERWFGLTPEKPDNADDQDVEPEPPEPPEPPSEGDEDGGDGTPAPSFGVR